MKKNISAVLPGARFAALLAAALFALLGCAQQTGREIVDRVGRTVRVRGPVNRIVSTAPSNTEIIVDLGLGEKLVAIDRHSADVAGIPPDLPLLDFFFPDGEALIALKPDLILASGHNATGTGEDPFRVLEEAGIAVAYISMSRSINGIYEDIAFTAELLGVPGQGEELISSTQEQVEALALRARSIEKKRTVYFEISAAPEIFTFGRDSYLNDMISVIGGINIFGGDNWLISPSVELIIERNPDVILTNVNYLPDPVAELKARPGFEAINAVIHNRVYRIDTNSSVRPSARIVLALRQMAQAVYPEFYEE